MSYRNCVYNNRTKSIHLFTWDAAGNRVFQELPYKPYLYLESKDGDEKSIFGTAVKKKEFSTLWDRNKFVKESGIKRIFENLPPYQHFLIDNYYHLCENDDFAQYPLKLMVLDIECPSDPEINGGIFAEPEKAEQVINLLTCYDSFSKVYTMFGLKEYTHDRSDVDYHHCKSEKQLLKKFIGFFTSDYPDTVVTYNGSSFDIPYLINRITMILDEDWAKELSPIGRIYEKINQEGKFGQPSKEYVIEGISCLDYYVMYKKFAMEPLESYKLDYVAEKELGENKVEYDGSLWELAETDWNKFCEYNLVDVELLVKLDQKLKYVDLLRFIAYLGLCNMENAVKTLPVVNGAVAIRARFRNERIPTFVKSQGGERIPGGYVADPKLGFSESVVSFDANSLYPSVMISLNLSPETKIGRLEKVNDIYHIHHVSGRTFELSAENFKKFLLEEEACLSKSGFLFSQKKKGIMPEFLDSLYTKRKKMKSKMFELETNYRANESVLTDEAKAYLKYDIQKCNTVQHAYKITLNSTYGYCANKYAPLGDLDIGTSVTLTGQAVIKKSNDAFVAYINEFYPDIPELTIQNALIYNDTDSNFISLKLLEDCGIVLKNETGKISVEFYEECEKIENYINDYMNRWARSALLSKDPRFIFKRETINDSVVFLGKKYYVSHVMDNEGFVVDKFKYKGVDVVKTTIPKALKPYIKKIIETMVLTQDKVQANKAYMEAYEAIKELGVESIYKNSGINNYEKYARQCSKFQTVKGMPNHVKAAYFHDLIIDSLKLDSKYPKFKSGDKVKIVHVKVPNRYGIEFIGFKSTYPPEFAEIFTIDYEKMFDKIVHAAIQRFYDSVDWTLRKPNENVKIDLEDLLS
jgi:DNA polymerase elongation subunit (family B)